MLKTVNRTKTAGWMRDLASRYERARAIHPNDRLIILFDVDGTVVFLRYMMLSLLREYDRIHDSSYFCRLGYRVVVFVDNEPENLAAVSAMEDSDEIMLLHADTLFGSARSRLPRTTISDDTYDFDGGLRFTLLALPDRFSVRDGGVEPR